MSQFPLKDIIEAGAPNQVSYEIRVVWPDGQQNRYDGINLSLARAAERLEILAEELRESSGAQKVQP